MAKNVNRTVRLQWKLDTIKNCIYLQCMLLVLTFDIAFSSVWIMSGNSYKNYHIIYLVNCKVINKLRISILDYSRYQFHEFSVLFLFLARNLGLTCKNRHVCNLLFLEIISNTTKFEYVPNYRVLQFKKVESTSFH